MAKIHLIEGPVGAGKSTFAKQLGHREGCSAIALDDWMATLFRPDRPDENVMQWYIERKERCIAQIWRVAEDLLRARNDVILELGLIQRQGRKAFCDRMAEAGHGFTVYILDIPREERRNRVKQRNIQQGSTFSMEVPSAIFEMASDMWEPPDQHEIESCDMRFVESLPIHID